jgi:hypothetical protein
MGGSRLGLGLAAVALAAMGFSLSNIQRILDKVIFSINGCYNAYAGAELR